MSVCMVSLSLVFVFVFCGGATWLSQPVITELLCKWDWLNSHQCFYWLAFNFVLHHLHVICLLVKWSWI